jgi:hypothetical protein
MLPVPVKRERQFAEFVSLSKNSDCPRVYKESLVTQSKQNQNIPEQQ